MLTRAEINRNIPRLSHVQWQILDILNRYQDPGVHYNCNGKEIDYEGDSLPTVLILAELGRAGQELVLAESGRDRQKLSGITEPRPLTGLCERGLVNRELRPLTAMRKVLGAPPIRRGKDTKISNLDHCIATVLSPQGLHITVSLETRLLEKVRFQFLRITSALPDTGWATDFSCMSGGVHWHYKLTPQGFDALDVKLDEILKTSPNASESNSTLLTLNLRTGVAAIGGCAMPGVSRAAFDVLVTSSKSGVRLTKDQLPRQSKHDDAVGILKRLIKKDSRWSDVISLAGTTGRGYRVFGQIVE